MVRTLLIRGMLVGVVAGLLTFVFAKIVGEPLVDRAIAFEEQMDLAKEAHAHAPRDTHAAMEAQHDHGDEALVSRGVQSTIGLATGIIVYGAAVGGLFALVFAAAYGRIGPFGPRATAALLAGAAFLVIFLVPAIKYPPSPPAVGMAETIGQRTGLFFLMILSSLAVFGAALALGRRLVARARNVERASWSAARFFIVVIAVDPAAPPHDQRGARRLSGGRALALQDGLDRHAGHHVDDDRPALRRAGGAPARKAAHRSLSRGRRHSSKACVRP